MVVMGWLLICILNRSELVCVLNCIYFLIFSLISFFIGRHFHGETYSNNGVILTNIGDIYRKKGEYARAEVLSSSFLNLSIFLYFLFHDYSSFSLRLCTSQRSPNWRAPLGLNILRWPMLSTLLDSSTKRKVIIRYL